MQLQSIQGHILHCNPESILLAHEHIKKNWINVFVGDFITVRETSELLEFLNSTPHFIHCNTRFAATSEENESGGTQWQNGLPFKVWVRKNVPLMESPKHKVFIAILGGGYKLHIENIKS